MNRIHRLLRHPGPAGNDRGLVLLVTVIMIFILLIMSITFFAMASYETRQSTYREESSEAFYLADAGVERTRGELLVDGKWRANPMLTGIALGNGTYDLYVADSTYAGEDAIYIYAEGHVDRADRAIEVWADGDDGTPPLWAGNNIDGDQGNLCLDGWAHANNDADFGNNDSHLNNGSCDGVGDYSDGDEIKPPIMFTEPANYPGATYYFVNYVNTSPPYADILDAAGNVLNLGDDLSSQIKVAGGNVTIEFINDDIVTYFDPVNGIFRPLGGDSLVVLNFAEKPFGGNLIPNPGGYVTVAFQARASDPSLNAMIINSHYKGTSGNLDDRWKSPNWEGGVLGVGGHTRFEPKQGISALVHQLDQSQAGTELGTPDYPAMTYVTGSVDRISGDLSVYGALLALNDIVIRGGIQITYVDEFEEVFPPYLQYVVFGQAVALDIFVWREVPADTR